MYTWMCCVGVLCKEVPKTFIKEFKMITSISGVNHLVILNCVSMI